MTYDTTARFGHNGGRWWHYDKTGEPITFERWGELFEQGIGTADEYRRVGFTKLGTCDVSTVWIGIDHSFGADPGPLIFETMVFGGDHDQAQMRYATEAEATAGHARTVEDIRAGRRLWFDTTA